MNSADLYGCTEIDKFKITYYRQKTRTRRSDNAKIEVIVQDQIKELFEKYRDKTGKRVFNFHQMYKNESNFNKAINKGLKEIGDILKIEDLELYAARHSWATIALNKLNVNKYVVHEALNHVDDEMKVTDIYIEKDFKNINDVNLKVLDYILNGKDEEEENEKEA